MLSLVVRTAGGKMKGGKILKKGREFVTKII